MEKSEERDKDTERKRKKRKQEQREGRELQAPNARVNYIVCGRTQQGGQHI